MDQNFGGASNQRPRYPDSAAPNFQGMAGFPSQGFQGQPYQPGMNARFQQAEGGFGQYGNMVGPQFQQQYPQQQFNQQQHHFQNPQQQQQFYQAQQQQQHRQQQQQQQFHQHQYQRNPQQHQQNFQQQFQQKQYQKMMEQQQKIAQENQKKEIEMRKKRDFEIQQKKLQQMGGGMKKPGSADLSNLIGSLAQRSADKPATPKSNVGTSTGRSFFARPGTSYPPPPEPTQQKDHIVASDSTGQQQTAGASDVPGMTGPTGPQMSAVSGGITGPGFGNQSNDEDDFSDFQEAKPSIQNQGPNSTQWSVQAGNQPQPGNHIPSGQQPFQTANQHFPINQQVGKSSGSVLPNQQITGNQQFHGNQHAPSSQLSGNHPFHSNQQAPGNQGGNLPFHGNQPVQGNQYFPGQSGHNIPVSTWPNQTGAGTMASSGFVQSSPGPNQFSNKPFSTTGPSLECNQRERGDSQSSVSSISSAGMCPERPGRVSGQFTPVDGQQPGTMAGIQFGGQQGSPGQTLAACEEDQKVEVKEETEDERLERLYGIKIPDWCKNGHNLPGVYKDVKDAVTRNGVIDTGSLYPLLLASELSRDILGQIWNRVNKAIPGQLTDVELRMILGLVALGQTGLKVERLTLQKLSSCKTAPIPSIPENLLKPPEGWSFQKEHTQAPSADTATSNDPPSNTGWSFSTSITESSTNSQSLSQGGLIPGQNIPPLSMHSHMHSGVTQASYTTNTQGGIVSGQTPLSSNSLSSSGLLSWTTSGQNATPSVQGGVMSGQTTVASSLQSDMQEPGMLGMTTTATSQLSIPGPTPAGGNKMMSCSGSTTFGPPLSGQNSQLSGFTAGLSKQEGLSTSPAFHGFQSAGINDDDDFGDFHSSTSSLDNASTSANTMKTKTVTTTSLTTSLDSYKLKSELAKTSDLAASLENFRLKSGTATSLESFKLKTEQSLFTSIKPPPQQANTSTQSATTRLSTSLNDINSSTTNKGTDDKVESGLFPALSKPPNFGDSVGPDNSNSESQGETKHKYDFFHSNSFESKNENNSLGGMSIDNSKTQSKSTDKYDFLRGLDGNQSSVFATSQPTTCKKDDSFGDFEGFERAESNADDGFGDFQTNTNSSNLNFLSNPTALSTENTDTSDNDNWNAFASVPDTQSGTNFGDFGTSSQSVSEDDFGDFSQPPPTLQSGNPTSNFGDFFSTTPNTSSSVDEGRQRSGTASSLASFTSAVPLDSAQRYKQLCGEEEDADQHGSVWGRCLNSCLLTLTTCAVAVQSMSDPTIKQEILQSKKGQDYFKAIIEVHKVTKRIQVSLIKTDFFSQKLKDILEEINQTWKNISNFLVGTSMEPSLPKDNFTEHHVQSDEDKMLSCGLCLLNVAKATDSKISYGGREYHAACANFWCNRVDSILPSLWPVNSLI